MEVNVSVLGGTTGDRSVRIECPVTESLEGLLADHILELFLVESLDLLDLVRCAESVEEVEERNAGLDR